MINYSNAKKILAKWKTKESGSYFCNKFKFLKFVQRFLQIARFPSKISGKYFDWYSFLSA